MRQRLLRLAGRLAEPAVGHDVLLERGVEVVHGCAEAEQLVGLDVVVGLAERL